MVTCPKFSYELSIFKVFFLYRFKKEFKKVVHNNYIQKTKDKLSKLTDNSKLYLYNKIKHDIVSYPY
jgi:hypothetical protein